MTLDLLDMLLVSSFVFEKHVPWWMWILGVLSTFGASKRMDQFIAALRGIR